MTDPDMGYWQYFYDKSGNLKEQIDGKNQRIEFDYDGVPTNQLHWIICGGESGPDARPLPPDSARNLRDQCKSAEVPFFMKQMSGKSPIPDDLMIRESPDV